MNFAAKYAKRIVNKMQPSTFEEFSALAMRLKAMNLGQGFPDWDMPEFAHEYLIDAVTKQNENQYFRTGGHLKLVNAIADEYSGKFKRKIDPLKEVVVGNGATQILMDAFASFIDEGDETILFEPVFEFYYQQNELFGGKTRYFAIDPPKGNSDKWTIDFKALRKCFNKRTKMILLNTPHNPIGKMYTEEDIHEFISILNDFPNCIVLSDEVYEYAVFGGRKHLSIATYQNMWDRTISIYSAGKTFSCTGWRVGYGIGPEVLIKPMIAAQNWTTFCTNRPAQVAIGESIKFANTQPYKGFKNYYEYYTDNFVKKEDFLINTLRKAPFNWKVLEPDGGFFAIVDISNCHKDIPVKYFYIEGVSQDNTPVGANLKILKNPNYAPDVAFCRWLVFEYGVVAIPLSPFYSQENITSKLEYRGSDFIRFAICKSDTTLQGAAERLLKK